MTPGIPSTLVYDTVIVGGGPTGLTLATYSTGTTCLLEYQSQLGGCHSVRRDSKGYFSEHGPRVYNTCYVNAANVLHDVGIAWTDAFTPAQFSPEFLDGQHWYQWMSPSEIWWLSLHYTYFLFNPKHGRDISMAQFMAAHNFRASSVERVDLVCRFSDGAGAQRYTLNEFLNGFDQHTLGSFCEPAQANDRLLFPRWEAAIRARGVEVRTGTTVRSVTVHNGAATGVTLDSGEHIGAKRVILAVPPTTAQVLLQNSGLVEPGFAQFATKTKYNPYPNACFHFPKVFDANGAVVPVLARKDKPITPWGIIFMDMSGHLTSEATRVLSAAVTRIDVKSPRLGKTALNCTPGEMASEMLVQLGVTDTPVHVTYADVHDYDDSTDGDGDFDDAAYVATFDTQPVSSTLQCCAGLFSVGSHNGNSWYRFTSFEAAVCNALTFLGHPTTRATTLGDVIRILGGIVLILSLAMAFHKFKMSR